METSWQADGNIDEWLKVEWLKPQTFNHIEINEVGTNVNKHMVQYWVDDKWITISDSSTCGKNRVYNFDLINSSKCRLFFTESSKAPEIAEFKILRYAK